MFVYSSEKGGVVNHRKDRRFFSFICYIDGVGVKEELYTQKMGNKHTCKERKRIFKHFEFNS